MNQTTKDASLKFSKKQIQRAGEILISDESDKYNESMEVLSYWRSAHAPALESTVKALTLACHKHDPDALIASRLKRAPSIIEKLRRFNDMKLRNMQDIGGCRAVIRNTKTLQKIYREINKGGRLNNKNYIESPKDDGYRGIHIVYPVETSTNTFKIEIQLRTKAQHAWSTAVEIVDLFTNQDLKSNKGRGEWKEFFISASSEIEKLEKGVPPSDNENLRTFMSLTRNMKVKENFLKFSELVDKINSPDSFFAGEYNLITLTKKNQKIEIKTFKSNEFIKAAEEYLQIEKKQRKNSDSISALVSLNSLHNLKEAYPNYFADSKYFIYLISTIEAYGEIFYPRNYFARLLSMAGFGKSEKERLTAEFYGLPHN